MKNMLFLLLVLAGFSAKAQTATEPTIAETVKWMNTKLAFGIQVARVEFVEKNCGLCFYTKTGVTGTCVHLANIDPETITAGDNGSGGRAFNLVAKSGLHAATATNKNGVATNAAFYNFQFRPEANSATFDDEMIAALKRLVKHCSK